MRILTSAALAAAIMAAVPAASVAQDLGSNFKRDKNTSVRQRPRPDYEAIGVKAGGFTLYPRVTVEAVHDDNVYAVATGEQSDVIWRVKPELAARSNWSRHALGAFASASINRYADFDTENTEEYTLGLNGRLDVERGSYVSASAQWQALTEPRTAITAGTPAGATAKPVEYYLWSGNLTGVKEFNRLRLTGKLDTKKFDYDDQGSLSFNQNTRDRDEFYYGGKAEYAVSPDTAVFASLVGNTKEYDVDTLGRAAAPGVPAIAPLRARDSDGYAATVGANFDLSQAIRGEVEAGYMSQSYDNYAADIDGFSARGRVEWFPTELTTLNVAGSRSIEESTARGSQGYLANSVSAGIDHELLRNVLLAANASYGKDKYEGIDRDDKRTGFNASAAYLLNRNVGLFLTYTYLKQESSGTAKGSSFTDNKLAASVALQF
ncbi:outer membrane beta-barrel protein [Caulobacter sp. DWR1-3-2b1]|uniref:outer membrane beta-barrel protein n=1 Tax=Caulobacter sp. DWR1-3-2b1 TaxID=2804670 RepID=UPI003CF7CB35